MTLNQLFDVIQKTAGIEGFSLSKVLASNRRKAFFVLGDELSVGPVAGGLGSYTAVSGVCVSAYVAPHKNQAEADTSYYVAIEDWKYSKGKTYKKIKLSKSQTEPTIVRKLTAFLDEYKEYSGQLALESKLEELLK